VHSQALCITGVKTFKYMAIKNVKIVTKFFLKTFKKHVSTAQGWAE